MKCPIWTKAKSGTATLTGTDGRMKKPRKKNDPEMQPEYDFSAGIRGKEGLPKPSSETTIVSYLVGTLDL